MDQPQDPASAGDLPAHVHHWPKRVDPNNAVCGAVGCVVTDVSQLHYYICGLRCDDHRPLGGHVLAPRPEPTYVSSPIKQPTGRPALPRRPARRKK